MNNQEIKAVAKKTERYWFEDGIWEIGFGLVNILLAAFFLLVESLNPPGIVLMLLQVFVILGAFLGMSRLVKLFKERVTYPRTGYVAYRKPARGSRIKRSILTAFLAIGLAGMVAAAANVDLLRNTQALVTAILMAGALVYLGFRFNLARLYGLAVVTALLGAILSLLALPDLLITAIFFGGFGLLMVLSGTFALLIYLSHTQPVEDLD